MVEERPFRAVKGCGDHPFLAPQAAAQHSGAARKDPPKVERDELSAGCFYLCCNLLEQTLLPLLYNSHQE